jgi:hypothetical protein
MATFVHRVMRAALLNAATFEEVEHDRSANGQAMALIVLSSLAAGIGAVGPFNARPIPLLTISFLALALWIVWALVTLQIGTRILPATGTHADLGQLLRTIGFATAPGLFRVAGAVPGMTTIVFAVTAVWMLAAMIVAVRQALDYVSTLRAVAVCALGFVLAWGMAFAIGIFCSPPLH